MGCPARCIGYELMADLDFATATTSLRNWTMGLTFRSVFEGNGYTISNLSLPLPLGNRVGLFRELDGVVRNLGLINPSITASARDIGVIAGENDGTIAASWVSGGTVTATGTDFSPSIGGLAGDNKGHIIASYSTASVNAGSRPEGNGGGLVSENLGSIIASYAAGQVTGTSTGGTTTALVLGGLVGESGTDPVYATSSIITDSYCSASTGQTVCVGNSATTTLYNAAQLQTPTGYTGIYENWNVDIDGDTFPDNPWRGSVAFAG